MSLIRCPECKNPVSSTVQACPHCGYVISEIEKENAIKDAELNPVSFDLTQQKKINREKENENDNGVWFGGFLLAFLFGLIGLVIMACVGKKDTKSGAVAGFFVQLVLGILLGIIGCYRF